MSYGVLKAEALDRQSSALSPQVCPTSRLHSTSTAAPARQHHVFSLTCRIACAAESQEQVILNHNKSHNILRVEDYVR